MLLHLIHYRANSSLEEVDDSIEIEFWAQQIKKHILALNLIKIAHHILQFIEHREDRRSIGSAGDHLPHIGLQLEYLLF